MIGKRIEITALRADGTEFPVELAVCRVDRSDPPVFTAYLRDLTKQKEAEAALAERTRLAALTTDVAIALARGDHASRILQDCSEAIVRHLDATLARIWTLDDDNLLQLKASAGIDTQARWPVRPCPRRRRPDRPDCPGATATPDQYDHGGYRSLRSRSDARVGGLAFAGFPLIIEQRLVGVMALFAREPLSRRRSTRCGSWRTASPWELPDCSRRSRRKTPGKPRWRPAGRRPSFWPT